MDKKHLELLGWEVKDTVTGFKGVVTHVGLDLYGCVQALVQPGVVVDKESNKQTLENQTWFDVSRLEKIGEVKEMQPVPVKGDQVVAGSDTNKPVK